MKTNLFLKAKKPFYLLVALAALFFLGITSSNAQCTIEVQANNGYVVEVSISPVSVNAPENCQWGYTYSVNLEYEVSITGNNAPSNLFTLQGSLGCGNNNHFFNLPNSGGSGTVTTANAWTGATNCSSATPLSLECNTLTLQLQGPGLPYQTVNCEVDLSFLEEEEDEEEEEESPELSDGACSLVVASNQNYSVDIEIEPIAINAPSDCQWGYTYSVDLAYDIEFNGNAPTSLWTLQGTLTCNGVTHFFNLPNSGGSGTVTSAQAWTNASNCANANPELLECGSIELEIYGPGISSQTLNCSIDFDQEDEEEDPEDGSPSLACPDDVTVLDSDGNCEEFVEVPSPQIINSPEAMEMANGTYLTFDGDNDYLAIENLFFQGNYPAITVEAWIRTEEDGNQQIVSFDRQRNFQLTINSNGASSGRVGWSVRTNQGIKNMGGSTRVDDGEWHHVAATYNNGYMRIYVDGNLDAISSKGSQMGFHHTRYGFIGTGSKASSYNGQRGPHQHFEGDIREIRIWDRALTASEFMQAIYPNPADENLLLWYDFSEGSGTAVVDLSVQGNNGNLFNMNLPQSWNEGEIPSGYSLINDFNGSADASDTYPPGVTVVTWTLSGPEGIVGTCEQTIEVLLSDPEMVCDSQFNDYIWRGSASDEWENAANWLEGEVPPAGSNVTIHTETHDPLVSGIIELNNLLINPGSSMVFENSAANLKLGGDFVNNGSFAPEEGKVTFNGGGTRLIKGASVPVFHAIRVDATDTLRLLTDIELTGALQPNQGVFDWNNFKVTLRSNEENTGSIGEIKSSAEIIGDSIRYQRYYPAGGGSWRMLCSPLTDATFEQWNDDFPTTGFPGSDYPNYPNANNPWASIRSYDESITGNDMHSGFVAIENVTDVIENGIGYFTYFVPAPTLVDLEGSFKRGSKNWELSHTDSNDDPYQDGWNLVGNPYPSAIDWESALGWNKTNIAEAIYAYDPINGQYSSYVGGVSIGSLDGTIASHQAFWVKAEGTNASMSINERAKVNSNGVFFKSMNVQTLSTIRIKLETENEHVWDETVLGFHLGSLEGFDPDLDAFKFMASNAALPNLALLPEGTGSRPMGIAMIPPPEDDLAVPLFLRSGNYSSFTLRNTLVDSYEDDLCLLLEDLQSGDIVPFNQGDSYSFTSDGTPTEERFILHVSAALDVTALPESCPNAEDGSIVAQGFGEAPWNFTWRDEMGQIIATTEGSSTSDVLSDLTPGFYEVEVTNDAAHCNSAVRIVQVEAAPEGSIEAEALHASCNNEIDGSIEFYTDEYHHWNLTATHQESGDSYQLFEVQGDTLLSGLPAGIYNLQAENTCGIHLNVGSLDLHDPLAVHAEMSTFSSTVSMATGGTVSFINNSSTNADLFIWDFGDGQVDSSSYAPQHPYANFGNYTVRLTARNAFCSDQTEMSVTVTGLAGEGQSSDSAHALGSDESEQADKEEDNLDVYAAQEKLHIAPPISYDEAVIVRIFNLSGQQVLQADFNSLPAGWSQVDISALPAGLYTYGIHTADELLGSGEFVK